MPQLEKNYAEAIFSLGLEDDKLNEYHQSVKELITVLEQNKKFEDVLSNAFISKKERHEIIDRVFKGKVEDGLLTFFHVINENGRMNRFHKILIEFNLMCNEHFNIIEGICYSSFKLESKQLERLMDALSKREGKQVHLTSRINKELIGGLKIIIGDRVYDSSILSTVENIRRNLLKE